MSASTLRLGLAAVASLACVALTPQPAHASAYGIQHWGGLTVHIAGQSVGIPAGQLAHMVEGSGRTIRYEWGHVTAAGNVCNWRIDYVYFGMRGHAYRRIRGRTRYHCDRWAYGQTVYPGRVRYGRACAQLYRSGAFVARQCHNITA